MQTLLTYFAILLTGMILYSQNTIEVNITGFDSNDGEVKIALYDNEDSFLNKPEKAISSTITNNKASVTFDEVPDGIYAISCYHDEDADGKLNFLWDFILLKQQVHQTMPLLDLVPQNGVMLNLN